ncbi:pimeloyl-ACP methyl ester carboxylesterase [Flavobacterium sp. 9]|uniref:epoxide hydrolase family protein n=1 Tax=Flavobacterium sp. 9 TaxID=2035198 RepID=UPI000C1A4C76|nr:epoxide hydrolase [Flavobacterium sp. 9]PIF29740.1 pimeloyl-ACP methyl ester carboxylesterase [Flavobacterium sp. 9]
MKTIHTNKRSIANIFAIGAFLLLTTTGFAQKNLEKRKTDSEAIRPYHITISEKAITELRERVNATRWPQKETVQDQSQGVKLAQIQGLVKYWGTDYDWHKTETKLNALPQFVTNIDGLDIQFIHIKSKHKNALPIIITHGWPGSFFELLKVIGPLTDPTAYGGKAEDAFDVVIPSMPGYGFSEKPTGTGWGVEKIGSAWDVLMKRLGYKHYVAQGGDWGSVIADAMARQAPEGLLGIHLNMPATVPADIAKALQDGDPAPAGLSVKEKAAFNSLNKLYTRGAGYAGMMVTRPQTLGYGLTDSPVGLASFFLDKFNDWTYSGGNAEKSLTRDEILDDISLYWFTNTANSSASLYWENNNNNFNVVEQKTHDIKIPVAVTVFPGEIYQAPKTWTEKAYKNLIYFNEVNKGGHFASWEEPQLYTEELRAAFKSLRK